MRSRSLTVLAALCVVCALAVAANASAEERAILPGDSISIEVDLSVWEPFTCSWTSDVSLDFVVEDPSGSVYDSESDSTAYTTFVTPMVAGTYTLTWINDGATLAHLSYSLTGVFENVEEGLSALMWTVIIAGIVVVAVVVIIVIVLVMGGKRSQQPVMMPQQPVMQQAIMTGHCPTCGTAIDPNVMFCSRCGTRFR